MIFIVAILQPDCTAVLMTVVSNIFSLTTLNIQLQSLVPLMSTGFLSSVLHKAENKSAPEILCGDKTTFLKANVRYVFVFCVALRAAS